MKAVAVISLVVACSGGGKQGPAGPPPPAQVGVVTVERKDCRCSSRRSARSTVTSTPTSAHACADFCRARVTRTAVRSSAGPDAVHDRADRVSGRAAIGERGGVAGEGALEKNKIELDAIKGLFKAGMISQQDVDNAAAAVADADAQVRSAQAQVQEARST